jgi:Fur family zinc uptake transcriptional regulator
VPRGHRAGTDSISDAIIASAKGVGFSVETQTVEVVGLCANCRGAA